MSVNILLRVRDLMFRPGTAWEEIKTERSSTAQLLFSYAAFFAAVAIVESVLLDGYRHLKIGTEGQELSTALWGTFWQSVRSRILELINLYLAGGIAKSLFSSSDDALRGFRIIAYTATPLWLAIIIGVLPNRILELTALGFVFYTPYLLYRGIRTVLDKLPLEAVKSAVVLVLAVVIVWVIVNYIIYDYVVL